MSARLPAPRRAERGFTILEMMIAMTISLFIISALAVVVLGASSTSRTRDRASDLQVNGRYAIDTIRRDLQQAGFLGISSLFFPDQPISATNPPLQPSAITVTSVCDTDNIGKLSQRIWGSDDSNPYSATCIPDADYLRGDVLVIRGLESNAVTSPFSSTTVYFKSAYEGGAAFVGPTEPDFAGTNKQPPYVIFPLKETVYYVAPYTTSATESPLVPALWRLRLDSGPAMVPELVASGVENMQIRYGIFQTNNTVKYVGASSVASDWDLVRSVQVSLLMRAATAESGYQNSTSYDMVGTTYTVNDSYPRLLMTSVIQQRN
jgi:type IV pilus assembly protein PilW